MSMATALTPHPDLEIAPLRLEHVQLVASNWSAIATPRELHAQANGTAHAATATRSRRLMFRCVLCVAPLLCCVWSPRPWSSPSAAGLIGDLISSRPSRCVFVRGVPACWVLAQRYGALGMLHTQPHFRGRGLAALAVEALATAVITQQHPTRQSSATDPSSSDTAPAVSAHSADSSAYAIITVGNDASESVFRARGFTKAESVTWLMVSCGN